MSVPDCKIMLMDSMGPITDKIVQLPAKVMLAIIDGYQGRIQFTVKVNRPDQALAAYYRGILSPYTGLQKIFQIPIIDLHGNWRIYVDYQKEGKIANENFEIFFSGDNEF